jgi:hypothetical protein
MLADMLGCVLCVRPNRHLRFTKFSSRSRLLLLRNELERLLHALQHYQIAL